MDRHPNRYWFVIIFLSVQNGSYLCMGGIGNCFFFGKRRKLFNRKSIQLFCRSIIPIR